MNLPLRHRVTNKPSAHSNSQISCAGTKNVMSFGTNNKHPESQKGNNFADKPMQEDKMKIE